MNAMTQDRAIWLARQVATISGAPIGLAIAIDGAEFQVTSYGRDLLHCRLGAAECDAIAVLLQSRLRPPRNPCGAACALPPAPACPG